MANPLIRCVKTTADVLAGYMWVYVPFYNYLETLMPMFGPCMNAAFIFVCVQL